MAEVFARGRRRAFRRFDGEPLALLVGLFDCALVLALAFAVQIAARNTAAGETGIVVPDAHAALPHYRRAEGEAEGDGARLGVAYKLANGEVVFVPDAATR